MNGDRVWDIGHATYSNGDPNFNDLTPPSVKLTIVDDDAPGVRVVRDGDVRVSESGQTAEYQVRLKASPKEGTVVVVSIAVQGEGGAPSTAVVANPSLWHSRRPTGTRVSVSSSRASTTPSLTGCTGRTSCIRCPRRTPASAVWT